MSVITILLLRRDAETLSAAEMAAISQKFPGWDINYVRTDPRDAQQHLNDCQHLNPAMVLLPSERPIPSMAMGAGFAHCSFSPDGVVMELEPLQPNFRPFIVRRPPMKPAPKPPAPNRNWS